MLVKTYDQNGKEVGNTRLPSEVFGIEPNPDLIHQVFVGAMANRRRNIAHTKDRAHVRGGGKKPWRQKGGGRARHGSRRSPIWKGGGVAFGPTNEKNYKKKINDKMRRKALFMVLSSKAKNDCLVVLDKLSLEKVKTKLMAEILAELPSNKNKALLALPSMDKNLILSARNLANVKVSQAKDLNIIDLLSFKFLILPKDSIKVIQETFVK